MAKEKQRKQQTASLRVVFEQEGKGERGELVFTGSTEFISQSAAPLSYLISHLQATFGADPDNWMKAGNELTEAWEAAKLGKNYGGEIVRMIIHEAE